MMISVNDAWEIILQSVKPGKDIEKVSIVESLGRILGEDIYSGLNLPPFDTSAMDGYALKAVDTQLASEEIAVSLRVIDKLAAGDTFAKKVVSNGQALKIMTGASVPQGADAVVMKEYVEADEDRVRVSKEVKPGENIRRIGEDVSIDQLVLEKGERIEPADIGILSALGKPEVMVARRPTVAILSTGNELARVDELLTEAKIYDVNSYTLLAQIEKYGGIPIPLGIAHDSRDELKAKIQEGLSFDILIISGGVSVGDYDLVRGVLEESGVELKIDKVAIKPGKPLTFGLLNDKPIFGLPGNVVASMVCFEKFVRPVILKMMGGKNLELPTITAELKTDIKKNDNRRHFVRAMVTCEEGKYYARPTKSQSSGALMSMVKSNGLIVVPEEIKNIPANSQVQVEMLQNPRSYTYKQQVS